MIRPNTQTRHPRGLATLFFTEMWERFSYYGMRAFLILYMTRPATTGALGMSDADAASIYGTYTSSVWFATIFGGVIADRLLGQYRSVLLGGIIIALGHFTLAFQSLSAFYAGLALIVIGTGLLKPNVSTLVGSLYDRNDDRRDAGFTIFYMGINLGAFLGPLIAGYLAEKVNWHVGFAAAGIGMSLGLLQYIIGRKPLKNAEARIKAAEVDAAKQGTSGTGLQFSPAEWKRIGAIVVLFAFASIFWGAYEQGGSTLTLFADRFTQLTVFGITFPASWFQAVPALLVFILAPIFAWLWLRLGPRNPSSPGKFAFGLLFVGLAFVVMVPAGTIAQTQSIRVSALWLATSYFLQVVGEMCLSPVGLSVITKLSPARIVGMMMGVWFLANAVGNKLAGFAAGFFSSMPLQTLFGWVAGIALAAALVLFLLVKPVRKLMGEVR